jgi:hypothetical protein
MNVLNLIEDIAARGKRCVDEGTTLLPADSPKHRTVWQEEARGAADGARNIRVAPNRPWCKFPAYNY